MLNFPSTGAPGFDFNITGTVAKESSEWTLDIVGTVEGYAIFNESVSACGKVSVPIGPKPYSLFIGSIDIDFPSCPASVGTDISITGKVHLHIPIPYGFGAVVSVKVSDKASGSMINCEEVDVSSTLLPPPNATGANVIVAGDSWGQGELDYPDITDKDWSPVGDNILHRGISEYLIQSGYEVLNLSYPGGSNLQAIDRIKNFLNILVSFGNWFGSTTRGCELVDH